MADEWDSSPVWAEARERMRAEVKAAFAPKSQTCRSCGRTEATAARDCPHCGASYVFVQPKLSKRAKLTIAAAALALLAAGGVALLLSLPSINHAKRATAEREAAQQAAFIRSERLRLAADQRLHRGRAGVAHATPAALVGDLQRAITADASARVKARAIPGPILRTDCNAVKLGPLVPNSTRGGYECVAVNANIIKGRENGGVIGYPFWAIVDYHRGTFSWCKINPKPGEMATQTHEPVVNPPEGCDLHI